MIIKWKKVFDMAEHKRKNIGAGGSMSRWTILLLWSVFVMLLPLPFHSCSSIECPVQNTVATVYELKDTLKDTLTVWTKRKDGKDTVLLNMLINATQFQLPISQQHEVDTLIFNTRRLAVTDTVWVEKNDMPHFESVDCGTAYFHQLTSIRSTHLGIDTLVITKSFVDYDLSSTHILVYFKARD